MARRGATTSTYRAWQNMKGRCCNPNHPDFKDYGARGIQVCERWLDDFLNFLFDMGECPSKLFSIDRIDNEGDYEPENCRWATWKQQAQNSRRVILITHDGQTQCVLDWAKELGMNSGTLLYRVKHGWPVKKALTFKAYQSRKKIK